jgi:hypothetical protein
VAGTTTAVVIGVTLVVLTFSQATVFAAGMRDYAREAAPKMLSNVNERRLEQQNPSPQPSLEAIEAALEPPTPFRAVHAPSSSGLRLIFLLFVGAAAGVVHGSLNRGSRPSSRDRWPK